MDERNAKRMAPQTKALLWFLAAATLVTCGVCYVYGPGWAAVAGGGAVLFDLWLGSVTKREGT